jgi:hypothetical protein
MAACCVGGEDQGGEEGVAPPAMQVWIVQQESASSDHLAELLGCHHNGLQPPALSVRQNNMQLQLLQILRVTFYGPAPHHLPPPIVTPHCHAKYSKCLAYACLPVCPRRICVTPTYNARLSAMIAYLQASWALAATPTHTVAATPDSGHQALQSPCAGGTCVPRPRPASPPTLCVTCCRIAHGEGREPHRRCQGGYCLGETARQVHRQQVHWRVI